MQPKSLPKHFREVKYQQNRELSPRRQAEKTRKRYERNEQHKAIMQKHRETYLYFDRAAEEWNIEAYY